MSSFLEDIELASKINKEIKKYEDEAKKLAEENIHLSMLNCELEQWLKEHKQRIDKAIEWIKEDYDGGYFECGEDDIKELLEILGSDKE